MAHIATGTGKTATGGHGDVALASAATEGAPRPDRSEPRRSRNAGRTDRDGRGRRLGVPPILSYGFRPFFFAGATYAALAIPAWLAVFLGYFSPSGPFAGSAWHAHEMLFGYLGAVVAGFILTAVPNWTGRLPLSGAPLAGLVFLWLTGRLAASFLADPLAAALLDLAFPAALAAAVWREVIAGRNIKNAPVAAMLSLFALANLLHHGEAAGLVPDGYAIRLALAVAATLIALIGGRVTPSFTRNFLARKGAPLPAPFSRLDGLALAATGLSLLAWVLFPLTTATGAALALAGLLLGLRLSRWRGASVMREPIVLVLHAGYLWLAVSLLLLGVSVLSGGALPETAALHALTAGAVGTMTLAVMTRASLGHTGRAIVAGTATRAIYLLVGAGALLRLAAPLLPALYLTLVVAGGLLWAGAFALFALRYGPILFSSRLGKGTMTGPPAP
ncbi:NnrS family protein [Afifella sp. IM 167]|uniref:NnrS family protein n=1 Tax=Afifella sp. IM 167 TaxID=2033586 RepID=UPI001CCB7278|nr:NnrS family protein [Afifella sp. IM 167]MBZ8134712.1 short-chain dehydrogenase [Afifella sp. IM 167]